jgi:hypothetical protein
LDEACKANIYSITACKKALNPHFEEKDMKVYESGQK